MRHRLQHWRSIVINAYRLDINDMLMLTVINQKDLRWRRFPKRKTKVKTELSSLLDPHPPDVQSGSGKAHVPPWPPPGRQTNRQTDQPTDRQTDRQTDSCRRRAQKNQTPCSRHGTIYCYDKRIVIPLYRDSQNKNHVVSQWGHKKTTFYGHKPPDIPKCINQCISTSTTCSCSPSSTRRI